MTSRRARHIAGILLLFAPCAQGVVGQRGPSAPLSESREALQFVHQQWTVKDGLPVDNLNDLVQSRDGYLWLATWDGLVRFDGARFRVFNVANTEGLPSNRIVRLFEAGDSTLWIATVEPTALVQYRDGRFLPTEGPFRDFVTRFHECGGELFVTDYSHFAYRFEPGASPTFSAFMPEERVYGILRDRSGTLWVGSNRGLHRFRGGEPAHFSTEDNLAGDHVRALHEAPDGALWIASTTGWTRHYDGRFSRIPVEGGTWQSEIPRIHTDADGGLWVATESAIYRYDGRRMVRVQPEDEGPWISYYEELFRGGTKVFQAPSRIRAHLLDHEGSLWAATNSTGLLRLRPAVVVPLSTDESPAASMTAVFEDGNGVLWFGGGLPTPPILIRRDEGRTNMYPNAPYVSWLGENGDGILFIGGLSGLWRFDERSGAFSRVQHDRAVQGMYEDRTGARWFVLAEGGVLRERDGSSATFGQEAGFPRERVQSIRETSDGAVWFITGGGGLVRYHEGRFSALNQEHGLSSDVVRGFYEDADGFLWIGTYGRGLNRIDARGAAFLRDSRIAVLRVRDGLYDDVIHAILEDDFGRLWMSTNRGLFWVPRADLNAFAEGSIERIRATSYDERDGMPNREANGGSHLPGLRDRRGRLWFPTQKGVVMVDPARVHPGEIPPPVIVEQVLIGDRPASGRAGVVHLGATERSFEIEYTGLSFLNPEQMRFRYKLEGYDDDWQEVSRRTAFYTQVPPGTYTFHVTGANKDGVWNETGAVLTLTVAPFFYETGWFYALCLLAGLGVAWAGYRVRIRQLRHRQQELETLVAERTEALRAEKAKTEEQAEKLRKLDEVKSQSFANISHEFRTPLTLILGPLKSALAGTYGATDASLRDAHTMMLRNGQRLLRLINQILDLAKVEAGRLNLDAHPQDLAPFVEQTVRAFVPLAERRRLRLCCDLEAASVIVSYDAEQMEKVILNLLSNALKFTPPGGDVSVRLCQDGPAAVIAVRDTGIGIPAEQLPQIFDRFYQVDASTTRTREGSGIGLALAREITELHGGTISVQSTPGEGSLFTVRLPLARDGASMVDGPGGRMTMMDWEETVPMRGRATTEEVEIHLAGEAAARVPEPLPRPEEEDRTTVLVVDDNADMRAFVRSILEPPYRVIEVADGAAGLEMAKTALPDVIVADVMMPKLDGIALSGALKDEPMTDCIPVILLTARAATEDEVEGLDTGADDYMTKPFEAEVLRARVARVIATRQHLRARFGKGSPSAEPQPRQQSSLEQRLRGIVEINLVDPQFNPEALASEAALSYHQLYRRLRDELDKSPTQFIRMVRVERAAQLLAEDAGSISEVAYAVGFNSLSYFNRAFREHFDVAPSAYVRQKN